MIMFSDKLENIWPSYKTNKQQTNQKEILSCHITESELTIIVGIYGSCHPLPGLLLIMQQELMKRSVITFCIERL